MNQINASINQLIPASYRNAMSPYAIPVAVVIGIYIFDRTCLKSLRRRIFACQMSRVEKVYNEASKALKEELFANLKDELPSEKGEKRVLEIGIGSGANLRYYPEGSIVLGIEPNIHFMKYLKENFQQYPHLKLERVVHSYAEDMSMIAENSINVVVCTIVLCCVSDVDKVLQEIKRILVPGGKFYYLEHVCERRGTCLNIVQNILTMTRIWPFMFDNCHLNRYTDENVKKAGFSEVDQDRVYIDTSKALVFKFIKSHLKGIATK